MKRTVFVAISFVAAFFVAAFFVAISSLAADPPPGRWELTETLTYDEYREGKLLTFHGHCDEKFLRPDIHDFRLERLSPTKTWIPMVFGRDSELDWKANVKLTNVRLYLKCPGASQRLWHHEAGIQLFARTWIEPNASYRMTWSRRHPQRRSAELHHIEFQLKGDSKADKKRPAFPQRAFLAEVVYEGSGVQFLGRTVRPPLLFDYRRHEMPAIGFNKDGQPVDPPDPGYQHLEHVVNQIDSADGTKPKPPPAMTTHHVGFSIEGNNVDVHVSDVATSTRLPQEPGKPSFVEFEGNLYRIELLTKNFEILRQDRGFWQQRIKQIRGEWANEPRR